MAVALIAGQVNKILLDTGVIYLDGNMLSPCEGDNSFVVDVEYRDIPYNGSAGKTKGLKRILRENATLTVHPKGLTQSILQKAIPGYQLDATGDIIESAGGRRVILDARYLDEVVLVGDQKDGNTKVITLYRALADNGLSLTLAEDSETILELVFSAHYLQTDLTDPIYTIEDAAYYGS